MTTSSMQSEALSLIQEKESHCRLFVCKPNNTLLVSSNNVNVAKVRTHSRTKTSWWNKVGAKSAEVKCLPVAFQCSLLTSNFPSHGREEIYRKEIESLLMLHPSTDLIVPSTVRWKSTKNGIHKPPHLLPSSGQRTSSPQDLVRRCVRHDERHRQRQVAFDKNGPLKPHFRWRLRAWNTHAQAPRVSADHAERHRPLCPQPNTLRTIPHQSQPLSAVLVDKDGHIVPKRASNHVSGCEVE